MLQSAWRMRWRAPEVALLLAERIIQQAKQGSDPLEGLRAQTLRLFAANRLGRGMRYAAEGLRAVRQAQQFGVDEILVPLWTELAACARVCGSSEIAMRLLRPIVERQRLDPLVRTHALTELAVALPAGQQADRRVELLDVAQRLEASAMDHDPETARVLQARVCVVLAEQQRRQGRLRAAADTTEAGLARLATLAQSPDQDSSECGGMRAGLVLERVQTLLDSGHAGEALSTADMVLSHPTRAVNADPAGWLRLALATRVLQPEGEMAAAQRLLSDAATAAQRHELGPLAVAALSELSRARESAGEWSGALDAARQAHSVERTWRESLHEARLVLVREFDSSREPEASGAAEGRAGRRHSRERAERDRSDAGVHDQRRLPATNGAVRGFSTGGASKEALPANGVANRGGSIRDQARQLMETLTSRSQSKSPSQPDAQPKPSRSSHDREPQARESVARSSDIARYLPEQQHSNAARSDIPRRETPRNDRGLSRRERRQEDDVSAWDVEPVSLEALRDQREPRHSPSVPSEPEESPTPAPAPPSSSVADPGLADLLAEALVAYETASKEDNRSAPAHAEVAEEVEPEPEPRAPRSAVRARDSVLDWEPDWGRSRSRSQDREDASYLPSEFDRNGDEAPSQSRDLSGDWDTAWPDFGGSADAFHEPEPEPESQRDRELRESQDILRSTLESLRGLGRT